MASLEGWPLIMTWLAYDIIQTAGWWVMSHSAPKVKVSVNGRLLKELVISRLSFKKNTSPLLPSNQQEPHPHAQHTHKQARRELHPFDIP